MDKYLESFLKTKSENTKVGYEYHITQMLDFVNKPITEITYGDLTNYREHFESEYSYNSMSIKIRSICSYFEYLYSEKEVIEINPTLNRKGKKLNPTLIKSKMFKGKEIKGNEPKQSTYYPMEDVKKLIRFATNTRSKAIICTYALTGIRASELVNLTLEDYENKVATVITKGGKTREIIFNDMCQEYIDKYLLDRKDCEYNNLFISDQKTPMDTRSMNRTLKNISERAGFGSDIHNHTLRHTSVSEVAKTYDIETARAFIGHSSISTTMRYIHSTNAEVRNVAMNMSF